MSIVRTPEDPEIRHQIARADVEEAKARAWRGIAGLIGLLNVAASVACVFAIVLGLQAIFS